MLKYTQACTHTCMHAHTHTHTHKHTNMHHNICSSQWNMNSAFCSRSQESRYRHPCWPWQPGQLSVWAIADHHSQHQPLAERATEPPRVVPCHFTRLPHHHRGLAGKQLDWFSWLLRPPPPFIAVAGSYWTLQSAAFSDRCCDLLFLEEENLGWPCAVLLLIKVFLKRNILSLETILSACACTHACTHARTHARTVF